MRRSGLTASDFYSEGLSFDQAYDAGFLKGELTAGGYTIVNNYADKILSDSTIHSEVDEWISRSDKSIPTTTDPLHIKNWKTHLVTNMSSLFQNKTTFDDDISRWDTSAVTNMSFMFCGASAFDQDIGEWNTSNVTTMSSMFEPVYNYTSSSYISNSQSIFNQDISRWDTSMVTDMTYMFAGEGLFNQDISGWSTPSLVTMEGMFWISAAFTHFEFLTTWNLINVTNVKKIFQFSNAMSIDTYGQILIYLSNNTTLTDNLNTREVFLPRIQGDVNVATAYTYLTSSIQDGGKNIKFLDNGIISTVEMDAYISKQSTPESIKLNSSTDNTTKQLVPGVQYLFSSSGGVYKKDLISGEYSMGTHGSNENYEMIISTSVTSNKFKITQGRGSLENYNDLFSITSATTGETIYDSAQVPIVGADYTRFEFEMDDIDSPIQLKIITNNSINLHGFSFFIEEIVAV